MKRRDHLLRGSGNSHFLYLVWRCLCAYAAEKNTITEGVFIDEVDVSGMTANEAEKAINEFVDELRTKEISIRVNDNIISTTLGDMGYSYKLNNAIEQALGLGSVGNLIKRYKDLKDIANDNIVYPLEFSLDENNVRELISTKALEFTGGPD